MLNLVTEIQIIANYNYLQNTLHIIYYILNIDYIFNFWRIHTKLMFSF